MKSKLLNSGYKMPVVGLGTWKSKPGEVGAAVEYAILEAGYRHIDCAAIYNNEAEIGKALEGIFAKSIKREEVFVTSKLWNSHHQTLKVEEAVKKALSDLRLPYLDLYLMHWGHSEPAVPIQETWQAMEKLVKKGKVRSIGVANFTGALLFDLLSYAKIRPAVNQIELHPYNSQQNLVDYCEKEKIAVTAYSPLGTPGTAESKAPKLLDEGVIKKFAKAHGKTAAQVLIRWAIERGTMVIPKSVNPNRIEENIDVFDFSLNKKEMRQLNSLNRNYRYVEPKGWWGVPYFD